MGVVRERGRTADDRVIKAELHLPDRAGQPSIHATANDMGFQELAAALTPVCTDVKARITSIQMTVLEIIIAVLHRLPNGRHVGRHA